MGHEIEKVRLYSKQNRLFSKQDWLYNVLGAGKAEKRVEEFIQQKVEAGH